MFIYKKKGGSKYTYIHIMNHHINLLISFSAMTVLVPEQQFSMSYNVLNIVFI